MLNSLVLFELDDHSLSIEQLLLPLTYTKLSPLSLNLKKAYFKFQIFQPLIYFCLLFQTWFQYHSAEKRKQVEKNSQVVFHSNPQMPCDRHCSRIHVGSYDRITARGLDERAYFTELFRRLENPPNPLQKHFSGVYNSPFQSNQMRRSSYFQRPELNQDWPPRTKYAAKYARQPLGRSYRRHQPYQTMRPPSRF